MSLIQFERVQIGEVGLLPGTIKMVSTDSLATITTAGYINPRVTDVQLSPSDVIACLYSFNQSTGVGTFALFQPTISSGIITLSINVSPGNVLLPVVSGNFPVFNGITGQIKDSGFSPSNALKTKVVMLDAAPVVGHLAAFTDVNGTIGDGGVASTVTTPTVANDLAVFTNVSGNIGEATAPVSLPQPLTVSGNVLAGKSGTAGYLASFPAAALSGNLRLIGVASAGNFNVDISNASYAQSSVISIPDVGAVTGNFIVSSIAGAGVQAITSGSLQVSAGNLIAGSIAGSALNSFISYSPTAANGYLALAAVDAGAANNSTISNTTMGQSTVFTIPDPANAAARFLLGATAAPFTSGNFPVASGTGGLMVDSGLAAANIQNKTNIKAARTADIGGGGAGPISVAVAGMTANSIIVAGVNSTSNPVGVLKTVATGTGFDITFTGDPGASAFVDYVTFIAAQ